MLSEPELEWIEEGTRARSKKHLDSSELVPPIYSQIDSKQVKLTF